MNEQKSIYACYEEIKQREISELIKKIEAVGGRYVFPEGEEPFVVVSRENGPVDEGVSSVEIQDISGNKIVVIYNLDSKQIMLSDIQYSHIEFITDAIPGRTFSKVSFKISALSREDLESIGFDASDVDDDTMERLADKLGEDYCEQLFWTSLEIIAEEGFSIPRKGNKKDEEG